MNFKKREVTLTKELIEKAIDIIKQSRHSPDYKVISYEEYKRRKGSN